MDASTSSQPTISSSREQLPLKSNTAALCRVGGYRQAAMLCLKRYRQTGAVSIELAYALAKLGRAKISIQCCLTLLEKDSNDKVECIKIITEALKSFSPSIQDVEKVNQSFSSISLTPAMVAMIGTQIRAAEACDYFFESRIQIQSFSENSIKLIQAFKAKFTGDELTALSIAQDLVANNPSATEACLLAAELLISGSYCYEARRFIGLALRNDPNNTLALESLGICLYKEARWKATRKIYAKIHKFTKDDISLANSLVTLPIIALNERELPQAVQGFRQLDNILQDQPQLLGIVESLKRCSSPLPSEFYLPYEGQVSVRKNFELIRGFQRLSAKTILDEIKAFHGPACKGNAAESLTRRNLSKPSIAFISRFFSYHSNLAAHHGLIKHLNKQDFHITIIHRDGTVKDDYHLEVNQFADRVIYLTGELGKNCGTIAELDLDILFFTDIGMNPLDSILAMPHLARHQITSWGLPHTTGVQEIDYYLRSAIFADCENQSEYTEQLVDLPGYIGYFSHAGQELSNASRDYFLLPPDRFLVGCLQSLHKIHPEFDGYLEEVAKIDESIMIIISPTESDQLMRGFLNRLKKSAPTAYQQLCIVQRTSVDDFFSLNAILDLNLDTIHYGSGISFIQAAWCGPPCVTQHSNLVRGATVSRSYFYAGIEKPPIAYSKDEYIDLVRYYFENRESLAALRAEIQTKAEGTIYNNADYIQSYESFFRNLVANSSNL